MILNVVNNQKILKDQTDIYLPDLTIITGENGSGKTQLLEYVHQNTNGITIFDNERLDMAGEPVFINTYALFDDNQVPLMDMMFMLPGFKTDFQNSNHNNYEIINSIKADWEQLLPVINAYRFLREDHLSDEIEHLKQLNQAITKVVKSYVHNETGSPTRVKEIQINDLRSIKKLEKQSSKSIDNLNLVDFMAFYEYPTNIFSSALNLLFHQFNLKQKYYNNYTLNITPPWDTFNEILNRLDFKYYINYLASQSDENPMPIILLDKKSNIHVDFSSLSSGETTILSLIFALYHSSNNGRFPQVMLLDEPDAHLHPSLTQTFIGVIKDVFVKDHGVKVILSTHSPSTVALAPQESIYIMDRDLGYPIKGNKKDAIEMLTSGLSSVTIEEGSLGISYNIKQHDKNILFTEGITDKITIEIAWEKLYPNIDMPFYIQDCFSASFLGILFDQGNISDEGIFNQFPTRKLIALFDFDNAGYNNYNRKKKFQSLLENDPRKCLTRFNGGNGYLMLLPVPNFEEIEQQVIKNGNETYEEDSSLTIEMLMFDKLELKQYFTEQKAKGGGVIYSFIGNKKQFAESLKEFNSECFNAFIPLFTALKNIFATN